LRLLLLFIFVSFTVAGSGPACKRPLTMRGIQIRTRNTAFCYRVLLFRRENTHMGMLEYDRSQEDKLLKALILGETSPLTSSRILHHSLLWKNCFSLHVEYQQSKVHKHEFFGILFFYHRKYCRSDCNGLVFFFKFGQRFNVFLLLVCVVSMFVGCFFI
jgi:hypothetical protein